MMVVKKFGVAKLSHSRTLYSSFSSFSALLIRETARNRKYRLITSVSSTLRKVTITIPIMLRKNKMATSMSRNVLNGTTKRCMITRCLNSFNPCKPPSQTVCKHNNGTSGAMNCKNGAISGLFCRVARGKAKKRTNNPPNMPVMPTIAVQNMVRLRNKCVCFFPR